MVHINSYFILAAVKDVHLCLFCINGSVAIFVVLEYKYSVILRMTSAFLLLPTADIVYAHIS